MKKLPVVGVIVLFLGMTIFSSTGTIIIPQETYQELIEKPTFNAILSIIEVRGQLFFYIIAKIQNKLPDAFENINWSIVVDGGIIFCGRKTYGTIPEIRPGQIINLFSNPIFGIGKIESTVRIHANSDLGETRVTCDGFVFGPFVLIERW